MSFNCLNNSRTNQQTINVPEFVLTEEQETKLNAYLADLRKKGCVINPNNKYMYLCNAGIDPTTCMKKKVAEPVVEQVANKVENDVEDDVVEHVDNEVEDEVENDVKEPVFPILYLNDKKQTLINRIEELNREATLKGKVPTKIMPKDGLEFLHHPESITIDKSRYKQLKAGDSLSINELAVLLRQVAFNMVSYDKNLANYLNTEKYALDCGDCVKVGVENVINAMKAALKNVPGESDKIDMTMLGEVVKHLKAFVKDNLHIDVKSVYEIGKYDYDYAVAHINEQNCGLRYGDIRRRYRYEKVSQKELTEASANHRVGKAAKLAEKLKNMWIVDFYQEWDKLTTKQKRRLTEQYGVSKREPKNMKELDALFEKKLISIGTYYNKKKLFN